MATDHIHVPIEIADGGLVPSDAKSGREDFPFFSFEVEQLYHIRVVKRLRLLFQEEVIMSLHVAAASHYSVVCGGVFGILQHSGEMFASFLFHA